MNGLDVTARGLARKALESSQTLLGPAGAYALKHQRSEVSSIVEPVADLLERLDMSPSGFGALYDAGSSDFTALTAFTAAMTSAAPGLVRLDPKTIYLGQSDSTERLEWTQSNAGLIGAGIDRTVIQNLTNATDSWSLRFGAACENVVFSDMTFNGRVGCYASANSLKSIIFNRCKFTTSASVIQNAVQMVTDTMTSGIEFIFFIDCMFYNPGRMGVEIQNHGSGTTVRYGNIHFIRPRFIGAGQASASLGMGISLTGYGDTVILDRPWFDGNKHIQLENVGCSRLRVRDMIVRASTLPTNKRMMSWSNASPMYDCEVDGFQLVGDLQSNLVAEPTFTTTASLTTATPFYIGNAVRPVFRRIRFSLDNTTSQTAVMDFGDTTACSDITVVDSVLTTTSDNPLIKSFNCTGNHVYDRNTLTSTAGARTSLGALIACTGSGTANISRNKFSYASGTAATVFRKTGSAVLNVGYDNIGITMRYRATHTIAAGATTSTSVAHGLPGAPTYLRAYAQTDVGGAAWPSATSTNIQANIGRAAKTTVLTGSKTYDAPSIADGAATSTTVTVTGAVLGDIVDGVSLGVATAGLTMTGTVTAANTVTVVIFNKSGGVIDLASTTLFATVLHVTATAVTVDIEAEYAW